MPENTVGQDTSFESELKQEVAMRDQQLVQAAQAGSSSAFAEIQALYAQRLYRRIAFITKNREDAEDVLQDTFMRAYLAIHSFERRSSVYSWLTRIAINSALMVLRRRRSQAKVFGEVPYGDRSEILAMEVRDDAPDPEQLFAGRQRRSELLNAIRKLDPKLRQPLELFMSSQCSMNEIARALDLSVGAVKARLHRARRRLAMSKTFRYPGAKGHFSDSRSGSSGSTIEGRHG